MFSIPFTKQPLVSRRRYLLFDVHHAARLKSERQCIEYLQKVIWRDSAQCPECFAEEADGKVIPIRQQAREVSPRLLFLCGECRYQFTVTSRTLFERSHLQLKTWFTAMDLVFSHSGLTIKELQQEIATTYKTAWVLRKILREDIQEFEVKRDGRVKLIAPSIPRTQGRWIHRDALMRYRRKGKPDHNPLSPIRAFFLKESQLDQPSEQAINRALLRILGKRV